MKLRIERSYLPQGTFGSLYIDDKYFCHTVERAWKNNQSNISCIPEGVYDLVPHNSHRHGKCFIVVDEVLGVTRYKDLDSRWGILFHPANWPRQLEGCIAPVQDLLVIEGAYGGNRSRFMTGNLFGILGDESHTLEIVTKTI